MSRNSFILFSSFCKQNLDDILQAVVKTIAVGDFESFLGLTYCVSFSSTLFHCQLGFGCCNIYILRFMLT